MKVFVPIPLMLLLVAVSAGARDTNDTHVPDIPAREEITDASGTSAEGPDEYLLDPITVEGRRIRTTEKAVTTTQVTMADIEFRSDKVLKELKSRKEGREFRRFLAEGTQSPVDAEESSMNGGLRDEDVFNVVEATAEKPSSEDPFQ